VTALDVPEVGPLRRAIETAGVPMNRLTVLAPANDPFRVDTPARHRDGAWLAEQADEVAPHRTIHLRGLHYALISKTKPNGTPYTNSDADWLWLQSHAAKAARWLGYIGFDRIVDQRNAEPLVRMHEEIREPQPYISVGVDVEIPDADDLEPHVGVLGFAGRQHYRLALVGEKSSLEPILGGVAARYGADLYLPTGEISDTMAHRMAAAAAADGRPLVVCYFADADPSGWQMPISLARKLQAFKALSFPELEFRVHRVALTPEQVVLYGLPSTPLKDTERRADRWQHATGTAQTEIDALAALRPDLLRRIAEDAVAPYYDHTLDVRVWQAEQEWRDRAEDALASATDPDLLDRVQAEAAAVLDTLRDELDALNAALRIDPGDVELPVPVVPTALDPGGAPALVDSRDPFPEQCRRLIASKTYEEDRS
jgi:hypothetical protein